jgi:gamma-glutamyltranspeptidase/glutathione hydrolase
LPFSVLVEQSVHLAKKGSVTSKNQEYLSSVLSPVISNSPELLSLFQKDGSFLGAGERFFNKELGLFLEQFLYEDPTGFYKNEVCPLFYDTICEGGVISLKDLQDYTPKTRKPLVVKYRGCDIFMNPKPSTGGALIKEGLKDLSKIKNVSKKDVEAALFAISLLKDRDAVGSTTHLTVIDHEKNVASTTTTNGVGAGFIIPKTGVMPNNMLGEKHLNPHGFHAWKSKQRIPSNICPTLVLGGKRGVVALGSAGSSRIISAILSVITNMLDHKMSLVDAVSSPRIHVEDGVLHCEPDGEKPKYGADEVVSWGDKNMYFGGVNACSFSESVGDERRDSVSV